MGHIVKWAVALIFSLACTPETYLPRPAEIGIVVARRCNNCHSSVAPPLFKVLGPLMLQRVLDKSMPPGQVSEGTPLLREDARLTADETRVFIDWAAAGYPDFFAPAMSAASDCTVRVMMAAPYTPPDPVRGGDEYRCFVLPSQTAQGKTVSSYSWVVGEPSEVHHVVAVVVDAAVAAKLDRSSSGWPCPQGLDVPAVSTLGSGGKLARSSFDFGGDAGITIPFGGALVLQMHYVLGQKLPDLSGVCLTFADSVLPYEMIDRLVYAPAELPPPQGVNQDPSSPLSRAFAVTKPFLGWTPEQVLQDDDRILAECGQNINSYLATQQDAAHIVSKCTTRVGLIGTVRTAHLHAHTYATGGSVKLLHNDGSSNTILQYWLPKYNWAWEAIEALQIPIAVSADDLLEVTCEWDNSFDNQWSLQYGPSLTGTRVRDPAIPAYVPGMGASFGEMCVGTVGIAVKK